MPSSSGFCGSTSQASPIAITMVAINSSAAAGPLTAGASQRA